MLLIQMCLIMFLLKYHSDGKDDILPRSTTAKNGGLCFNGNNCPSENRPSNFSFFNIGNLSGECLGNSNYAAFNIYDMSSQYFDCDCITLVNCINSLNLNNSDVKIKKCSIENAVNGFVIDESSLTVTARLDVHCDTLIHEAFDGSFVMVDGTILDITAVQTGFNIRINEEVYPANQAFTLTSNEKKTLVPLIVYNAGDVLVNQTKPEKIGDE